MGLMDEQDPTDASFRVSSVETGSRRQLDPLRQWAMVVCLTILTMLAMIDKNVITLLIAPIKLDLALSDVQIGFIIGTAFALANLLIGVPAGWMADRWHRKSIVIGAVLLWSVMAAACGLARSFPALFLARAGVGFAEGLIPAAAYSLIHDGIDPDARGRAFSIYAMATIVGTGLSLAFGGWMISAVAHFGLGSNGLMAGLLPWSITLIFAGMAGPPLTLLLLTFPEPKRRRSHGAEVSFAAIFSHLRQNRTIYLSLAIFSVMHAMMAQSNGAWLPALAQRRFGLAPQQMGPTFAAVMIIVKPLGLWIAGLAIDRLRRRGRSGAGWVAVASSALLAVAQPLLPLAPSPTELYLRLGVVILGASSYITVTSNVVAQVAPRDAIGRIIAVLLVVQGLFGSGLAPAITAFAAEHLFAASPVPIATSMSVVHGLYGLVALAGAITLLRSMSRHTLSS